MRLGIRYVKKNKMLTPLLFITKKYFRVEGLKPGRFHRLVQTSCGKSRVRRNTIPLLWCISTSLLDEVIQQATKNPENKNVRVKCEDIFSAIEVSF